MKFSIGDEVKRMWWDKGEKVFGEIVGEVRGVVTNGCGNSCYRVYWPDYKVTYHLYDFELVLTLPD